MGSPRVWEVHGLSERLWSFWVHLSHGNRPPSGAARPSDVEAIARLITSFLELHRPESPEELSQSSDSEADSPAEQG